MITSFIFRSGGLAAIALFQLGSCACLKGFAKMAVLWMLKP